MPKKALIVILAILSGTAYVLAAPDIFCAPDTPRSAMILPVFLGAAFLFCAARASAAAGGVDADDLWSAQMPFLAIGVAPSLCIENALSGRMPEAVATVADVCTAGFILCCIGWIAFHPLRGFIRKNSGILAVSVAGELGVLLAPFLLHFME